VRTNFDVGGDNVGISPTARTFGQPAEPWYKIEGVVTTGLTIDGGTANYWDYNTFEETRVQTLGTDAEGPTRGVQFEAILKSGGNEFKGSAQGSVSTPKLQANNIDDDLRARGITQGNPLKVRSDIGGDLGGRIITDQLWFYGALRRRQLITRVIGAIKPDGSPGDEEQVEKFYTGKLSYQMNPSNKLVGFWLWNHKYVELPGGAGVDWDSRRLFWGFTRTAKLEWQLVRGNSLALSIVGGYWRQNSLNPPITDRVGTDDIATLVRTGNRSGQVGESSHNGRKQGTASLTWYRPSSFYGNHNIKLGFDYFGNSYARPNPGDTPGAPYNYHLRFNNGAPFQIQVWNHPIRSWSASNYTSVYATDSWTMGRRFTLSLGARFAHDDGFVPASCRETAIAPGDVIFPAECFPKGQTAIYNSLSPRLYAVYDLSGDGKTVLKGGWGRFPRMRQMDDVSELDRNFRITATYRWRDLNGNGNYDPGEVNLDPNGQDFVSRSGPANTVGNPNEKQPHTDDFSISLERELASNIAIRFSGVHSRSQSLRRQNNLRPYETYDIPVVRPDPGSPGVFLTYYEFSPALAGARFEEFMWVNDSAADRTYDSFEVATSGRLRRGLQFMASYSATKKNIPFLSGPSGGSEMESRAADLNPNAEINSADRTWEWLAKASGAYLFPGNVTLSASWEHRSGVAFAREVLLTGGRTIPSIVLKAEPIGTQRMPNLNVLNIRAEKAFRVRQTQLTVRGFLYNVLNANTITALITRSGTRFLEPTSIMKPRIFEFGVAYNF
jgi:hypothetical protein